MIDGFVVLCSIWFVLQIGLVLLLLGAGGFDKSKREEVNFLGEVSLKKFP